MRGNKTTLITLTVLVMLMIANPALAAEESTNPLDTLGINLGFLITQFVNFGLLLTILTLLLWRPATNMLNARAEKIRKGVEDAAAAAAARRNAEAEAEKILAQARSEAQQLVAQASSRGEEVARNIEAEARNEAEKIRAEARAAAQAERDAELAGLRGQVVNIASAISQRLIGATLDEQRQKQLVTDFLTSVPADAAKLSGEVTVISAMPLEDAEKKKVEGELKGATSVSYRVDPAILGGLIVRSGDRVIDGSVRSSLAGLTNRLN